MPEVELLHSGGFDIFVLAQVSADRFKVAHSETGRERVAYRAVNAALHLGLRRQSRDVARKRETELAERKLIQNTLQYICDTGIVELGAVYGDRLDRELLADVGTDGLRAFTRRVRRVDQHEERLAERL